MKYVVYSVRDCVTSQSTLVMFRNDAEALRAMLNLAEDENSVIHKNPDDYQLCRLGYFDEDTNCITLCEKEVLW